MDACNEIHFTFDKIFNFVFGDHFLRPRQSEVDEMPGISVAAKLGLRVRSWLCRKKKTSFLAQESSFVNMVVCNAASLTCPRETLFAKYGGCNVRPFFGDAAIGKKIGEEESVLEVIKFNENGISVTFGLTFIPEPVANVIASMITVFAPMDFNTGVKGGPSGWKRIWNDLDEDASAAVGGAGVSTISAENGKMANLTQTATGVNQKVIANAFASSLGGIKNMLTDFQINLSM